MKFTFPEKGEEILIIKDSGKCGGNVYIAKYDEIKENRGSIKETEYPEYYKDIDRNMNVWFRLVAIELFSKEELFANFLVNTTRKSIENMMKSMCQATHIIKVKD